MARVGESTYEISRVHEKLKRVQGSGITSRGELLWRNTSSRMVEILTGKKNRLGSQRGSVYLWMCCCIPSFLGSRCQAWTASCDNLKGWWSVACCIPSLCRQTLHLPSFRGIVSQWVSFVTTDLLHADTRAVFLWPKPISTVGKQLNPSPNQCSLFNLSYWLACPSTDLRGWKNTNKLDGWERTTTVVAQTMKSHIFNNELLAAGGKKATEWR